MLKDPIAGKTAAFDRIEISRRKRKVTGSRPLIGLGGNACSEAEIPGEPGRRLIGATTGSGGRTEGAQVRKRKLALGGRPVIKLLGRV